MWKKEATILLIIIFSIEKPYQIINNMYSIVRVRRHWVGSRVSNGIRIFYTVNTGINGIRISPGVPVFWAVFSVYRYSGLFLTVNQEIRHNTGIPVYRWKPW